MEFKRPISKIQRDEQVEYLLKDHPMLVKLMEGYIKGEIDKRLSWTFTYVFEKDPRLIDPWIPSLLNILKSSKDDETKRNITRSLQFANIPDDLIPEVLEVCYRIMEKPSENAAQRVFAMTIIFNQVKKYPELKNELVSTLELIMPMGSAGFKSRASRILKELQKK